METSSLFAQVIQDHLELKQRNSELEEELPLDRYKNEDPFFGVGLRFGMTPGLGFRAEYERYQFENEDIDMAQAGLELNF